MSEFCKYYKQKKQYSIDSRPWSDVLPYEYKIGDAIGELGVQIGFIQSVNIKKKNNNI